MLELSDRREKHHFFPLKRNKKRTRHVLVGTINFLLMRVATRNLVELPYCYYYLRVLYFANFCDLQKIAKLSARKIFTDTSGTLMYTESQTA